MEYRASFLKLLAEQPARHIIRFTMCEQRQRTLEENLTANRVPRMVEALTLGGDCNSRSLSLGLGCILLMAMILCNGCATATVTPPATGGTAPIVTWSVVDLDSGKQDDFPSGNGTFPAKLGQSLRITFSAINSDGLKKLSVNESDSQICKPATPGPENVSSTSFPTPLNSPQNVVFSKSASGTVPISWGFPMYLTVTADCPSGSVLQSASYHFAGTAENWSGLVTQGGLTIRVTQQ